MAYRDAGGDQRVAELRALVATEQELHEAARRVRFEQDGANEEVDRVGQELAAAERVLADAKRGGLRAGLRALVGKGKAGAEAAVTRLRDELHDATARLDELVAREGMVRAQLDAIGAARAELAAREAGAGEALRAAEGPAGADYRALEAAIAAERARGEEIEVALRAIEQADVAVASVVQAYDEEAEARRRGTGAAFGVSGLVIHAIVEAAQGPVNGRVGEAVGYARDRLQLAVAALARLAAVWPAAGGLLPFQAIAPVTTLPREVSDTDLRVSPNARWVGGNVQAALSALVAERDWVRERAAQLAARQRDAEKRYLDGTGPTQAIDDVA